MFSLPDQTGAIHTLSMYLGKWVLLYAYPKDLTPGCTKEACAFRDVYQEFAKAHVVVLGISADSPKRHKTFAESHDLPFPLLSDVSKETIRAYGAFGEKRFMGRTYEGILRYSFLIDPKGMVAKIYTQVKPAEHAAEVLQDVKQLSLS